MKQVEGALVSWFGSCDGMRRSMLGSSWGLKPGVVRAGVDPK